MKLSTHLIAPRAAAFAAAACSLTASALGHSTTDVVYGAMPGLGFGQSVAVIGDINGDGYPEYVVGAPATNTQQPGAAHVIDGRWHYVIRSHQGLNDASRFGAHVAAGTDWNLDGVPDYVVGAPRTNVAGFGAVGMTRIFSGKDGAALQTFFGTATNANFGACVEFLGDFNGDGRVDLAVGAPDMPTQWGDNEGRVRIFSAANGAVIRDFWGGHAGGGFGRAMASVGDWNGDGVVDLAVASPTIQDHATGPGLVFVLNGATGSQIEKIEPLVANSAFGAAMASMGDLDGDGRRELIIGASTEYGIGAAHVVMSATRKIGLSAYGQAPGAYFGYSVAAVGDIDGDGKPDFAVASPGAPDEGLRVHSGANGQTIWKPLLKPQGSGWFGVTLAAMGDADGDGWRDILIGDSSAKFSGQTLGATYVARLAFHQPVLGFQGPTASTLSVHGKPLSSGGWADLELKLSGGNRPGVLIGSPFMNPMPIYGGTLVPTLDGLLIPYVTDMNGKYVIKGIPGGLGHFSLYCQAVTKSPVAPQGWGFSNAVRIDFLP